MEEFRKLKLNLRKTKSSCFLRVAGFKSPREG
jgi:hypothetical protein